MNMTHRKLVEKTYSWFFTASQGLPWGNIHIMITFKAIVGWIRSVRVFTNVSLNIELRKKFENMWIFSRKILEFGAL